MNSLAQVCLTLTMTLTIAHFLAVPGFTAGAGHSSPSGREIAIADGMEHISKKDIIVSGAKQILKDTKVGKRLDELRKNLIRRYRLEYRKDFKPDRPPPPVSGLRVTEKNDKEPLGVSFYSRLDNGLAPEVGFKSRLDTFTMSSKFDVFDHEIDCEISSHPINQLMGGTVGFGLISDGSEAETVIRVQFEF